MRDLWKVNNLDFLQDIESMNYENYIELYEAVYFFHRIYGDTENAPIAKLYSAFKLPQPEIEKTGINESVHKATMRILIACNLLDYDGCYYVLTSANKKRHRHIFDNMISKKTEHYTSLFNKAITKHHFFFDSISELEYEIYSRYNFQVTYETGKQVAKHINLTNKNVLELGGNSGGLATALTTMHKNCRYTIVDTKIPCTVGNELKDLNDADINFIEGNVLELKLPSTTYDYIIIMNLLHDFNDEKCLNILANCVKHCNKTTKFVVIEDILTSDFEPIEAVMHGLRLSIECYGGKQRTIEEQANLFSSISYKTENVIKLNNVHTMLIMGA